MSDIDPGKQIGRNTFSAQQLTEQYVRQISEPVNSQAASSVTETEHVRTATAYTTRSGHSSEHNPLLRHLEAFSFSRKSEL